MARGETERAAVQVRQRDVGREPQRTGEAAVLKLMRPERHGRLGFQPAADGIAMDDDPRRSFERLDEPEELRRTERASVLLEARSEVHDTKSSCRSVEDRLEHIRVGEIFLLAGPAVRSPDEKVAAV